MYPLAHSQLQPLNFTSKPIRPKKTAQITHEKNLEKLITKFKAANQVLGASPEVINEWASLADKEIEYPYPVGSSSFIGFEEKLILATAICGNQGLSFILVDRRQPVHDELGIRVEDPWQTPPP